MTKFVSLSGRVGLALMCVVVLGGCDTLGRTEENVFAGAAIGAVTGTAATVLTGGCIPCGAAIGGAVGSGGGFVYSRMSRQPGR